MTKYTRFTKFAQIEYHGLAGITTKCLNSIVRLIHFGDRIERAALLTFKKRHCFLLSMDYGGYVAVKSGFGSGYTGEGAHGLSSALQLLQRHGANIEEYEVAENVFQDINNSCMLAADLEKIENSGPVMPSRWYDYIFDTGGPELYDNKRLQYKFPATIPFGITDVRLVDLALNIEDQTDHVIFTAYKRLEDIVRERTGLQGESGQKLFSKAFQVDDSKLYWKDIDSGEQKGRASLFIGAYMAFRNRRAHRETKTNLRAAVREFLLINELFLLEAESVPRLDDDIA